MSATWLKFKMLCISSTDKPSYVHSLEVLSAKGLSLCLSFDHHYNYHYGYMIVNVITWLYNYHYGYMNVVMNIIVPGIFFCTQKYCMLFLYSGSSQHCLCSVAVCVDVERGCMRVLD